MDTFLKINAVFDFGTYGVLLFFLVSGYVIPMSLERHGSLRRFWVGRIFRMYPAFLLSFATIAALAIIGLRPWPHSITDDPPTSLLAHFTLLPDMLGFDSALVVYWTLAYEMAFYLVTAGLFVYGLHRHSAWWAGLLALTALVAGGILPDGLFASDADSRRLVTVVVLVVVIASMVAYLSGRRTATLVAGAGGVAFVSLPALNGSAGPDTFVKGSWQALLMLAIMFTGTVVYRAEGKRIAPWTAIGCFVVVTACVVASHEIHLDGQSTLAETHSWPFHGSWFNTTIAVAVSFTTAYALRHRRIPQGLAWLGTITYSLYLLHSFVIMAVRRIFPEISTRPLVQQIAIFLGYTAVLLVISWISYRMVELPGQKLGRRALHYLDARWPTPAVPAVRAPRQTSSSSSLNGDASPPRSRVDSRRLQ